MREKKKSMIIMDLVILAGTLAFAAGLFTGFGTCPVMEDHVMACHYAGQALKGTGILLTLLSALRFLLSDEKSRMGFDLAFVGLVLFALCIPGRMIPICPDSMMKCHMTQLFTYITGVIILCLTLLDLLISRNLITGEKHARKNAEA